MQRGPAPPPRHATRARAEPRHSPRRDFFRNYADGVPPEQCARGTEGHNTAQIGGFVMLPPVIAAALPKGGPPGAAGLGNKGGGGSSGPH
jgi:hypothetical protein